jgi:hypothetical protein
VNQLDESIDEYLGMTGMIAKALVSGRKTGTLPVGCIRFFADAINRSTSSGLRTVGNFG